MNLYENLDSYIRDTSDKWLVAEKKQLYAKKIQVGNASYKEKFTISFYVYSDKPSVTIKLTNSDLYLSCHSKKLALTQMNEKDPENTNQMFLFHVHKTGQVTCAFAPATDPQFFISTSKSNTSLVTVQPKSANTYIMEFVVPVLENIQI